MPTRRKFLRNGMGAGAAIALGLPGTRWALAQDTTDEEARIRSPFGSYPGYVSLMQKDFNRAGEDAWLLGFSYDFTKIRLKGLSAFTNFASGYDAIDPGTGLSDQLFVRDFVIDPSHGGCRRGN